MFLSKIAKEDVAKARAFIEELIKYYDGCYKPKTLFDENPSEMTKRVVTFDLITRQIRELEDLLRPKKETDPNGNTIRPK